MLEVERWAAGWKAGLPGLLRGMPALSLSHRCTQPSDGQLKRGSVLEGLVERHHAVADGFKLVGLYGVIAAACDARPQLKP